MYAVPESLECEALLTIASMIAWMHGIPGPIFSVPAVASVVNRMIVMEEITPDSINRLKALFAHPYRGKRLVLEKL